MKESYQSYYSASEKRLRQLEMAAEETSITVLLQNIYIAQKEDNERNQRLMGELVEIIKEMKELIKNNKKKYSETIHRTSIIQRGNNNKILGSFGDFCEGDFRRETETDSDRNHTVETTSTEYASESSLYEYPASEANDSYCSVRDSCSNGSPTNSGFPVRSRVITMDDASDLLDNQIPEERNRYDSIGDPGSSLYEYPASEANDSYCSVLDSCSNGSPTNSGFPVRSRVNTMVDASDLLDNQMPEERNRYDSIGDPESSLYEYPASEANDSYCSVLDSCSNGSPTNSRIPVRNRLITMVDKNYRSYINSNSLLHENTNDDLPEDEGAELFETADNLQGIPSSSKGKKINWRKVKDRVQRFFKGKHRMENYDKFTTMQYDPLYDIIDDNVATQECT